MSNQSSSLVRIQNEKLVKAKGSGVLSRLVITVGGISLGYLLLPVVPAASAFIGGYLVFSYLREANDIQHPETAEKLKLLLNSKTAKHPSIYESRKELKALYPMASVNKAIEFMSDHCEWVHFTSTSKNPLRVFGEIYAYIDPIDKQVYMPIDGLKMLMNRWQIDDSITVASTDVSQLNELPAVEIPAIAAVAADSPDWGAMALPGNRETLLNRLKAECPELLRLIKSPPIRLVGLQRTGKSTFARKLALLRVLFLDNHKTLWATPHREMDNLVPELLNPIGTTADGAKDFSSIEAHWVATQDAIDQGQQLNTTAVWDEFGSYDAFENLDLLGASLRSLLRESSKHGYYPVIVIHGDQSMFLPGVKNILTTLQQSTIKVETIGETVGDFGEMKPTGKVIINWLTGEQSELTVPSWLSVDYLLKMVKTDTKPSFLQTAKPESTPVDSTPKPEISERDRLELLFDSSPEFVGVEHEYKTDETSVKADIFDTFADSLTHESQQNLKSFVLWLKKNRGLEVSYEQIKGNWARNNDYPRSKESLLPLITIAKSQKLLSVSTDNKWLVAS